MSKTTNGKSHRQNLTHVSNALDERMTERPYQMLAAAIGVGFLLGAGVWKPLGRALLGMGAQMAISAVTSPNGEV